MDFHEIGITRKTPLKFIFRLYSGHFDHVDILIKALAFEWPGIH